LAIAPPKIMAGKRAKISLACNASFYTFKMSLEKISNKNNATVAFITNKSLIPKVF
jgi:hypothetical protein